MHLTPLLTDIFSGDQLRDRTKRILLASFAASLAAGAVSCAPANPPENQSTAAKAHEATAAFLEQIRADTSDYAKRFPTAETDEARKSVHAQEYSDSFAYFDSDSVSDEQKANAVDEFGMVYLLDPLAGIAVEEPDISLSEGSAVVTGSDLKITISGEQRAVKDSFYMTLKLTESGWKVSEFKGGDK